MPPSLNPGDPYRLVFLTRDNIFTATSANIADYDASVTSQANMSADLVALGTNWRVIGSTSAVDAKIHTDTDDSPAGTNGVPIYRLDGLIIASDYDDLWDGSIGNPLNVTQEGPGSCSGAWTGTRPAGIAFTGNELGAPSLQVVDGSPSRIGGAWTQTHPFPATSLQCLYAISDVLTVLDPTVQVEIDIKPGSDPNCFNANGHGVIPVAILSSDTFDVTTIDQSTLLFGGLEVRVRGNKGPLCSLEDTNVDGLLDMVCKFEDNADYWDVGDGDATLTGNLYDGAEFEGTDSICVVP